MFGFRRRDEPADFVHDKEAERAATDSDTSPAAATDTDGYKSEYGAPTRAQLKRATRTRKIFSLLTCFLLLVAVVFLLLVELGNTQRSSAVLSDIYFFKLDLTNIIPQTVPSATIINSIARTLGLHDTYQVGLWNFLEGYNNVGIVGGSSPVALYWFNPVEIILSELLAGATIALPAQVTSILDLIKVVSEWMFGLFLSGLLLSFVLVFTTPLSIYSRWVALFNAIFTFLAALLVTVATAIATAMFIIMRNAFQSVGDLNIGASLGTKMFVFCYIAVGCTIAAALIQIGECCCCASRRDVKKGKKRGSRAAWR